MEGLKTFEFIKDYPLSGNKVKDRIKFASLPHHLRAYLREVKEVKESKEKKQKKDE